eukprot:RCo022519
MLRHMSPGSTAMPATLNLLEEDGDFNPSRWRRVRVLGSGGCGTVSLATNDHGDYVAVKTISFSPDDPNVHTALQALKRELRTLRIASASHPNIVKYLKSTRTEACVHIFMEFCPGGSLKSLYNRTGPIPVPRVVRYTQHILGGLQFLHSNKIIHRDVKCDNVLLDSQDVAKLGDFGASTELSEISQKTAIGTFFWMAPEVLIGHRYREEADIWSLGCTVMEALTARRPFSWRCIVQTQLLELLSEALPPPLPPLTDPLALDFLRFCLVKDRVSR